MQRLGYFPHFQSPLSYLSYCKENLVNPGKSLYRGKAMVPYVQLSTNCGLGYSSSNKNIFFFEATWPSLCLKIFLVRALI